MAAVISLLSLRAAAATRKGSQGKAGDAGARRQRVVTGQGHSGLEGQVFLQGVLSSRHSPGWAGPRGGVALEVTPMSLCHAPEERRKDTQRALEAQMRPVGSGQDL